MMRLLYGVVSACVHHYAFSTFDLNIVCLASILQLEEFAKNDVKNAFGLAAFAVNETPKIIQEIV